MRYPCSRDRCSDCDVWFICASSVQRSVLSPLTVCQLAITLILCSRSCRWPCCCCVRRRERSPAFSVCIGARSFLLPLSCQPTITLILCFWSCRWQCCCCERRRERSPTSHVCKGARRCWCKDECVEVAAFYFWKRRKKTRGFCFLLRPLSSLREYFCGRSCLCVVVSGQFVESQLVKGQFVDRQLVKQATPS